MPQQKPQKFEDLPRGQQIQTVKNLMPYPALTLMVFLRPDLGYRILNPTWLFGTMVVEIVFACIAQIFTTPNATSFKFSPLIVYAITSFCFGIYQRRKRWLDIRRGVKQHSFYMGTSRLNFPWLPKFLQRQRRVERFVDPIAVFILGFILLFILHGLGYWLCLCAACLRVFEDEVYTREINQNLDMVDSLVTSEIQGDVVEQFDEPAEPATTTLESSVPTGLADDIQQQLKRRKAKQPPPPPKGS